MERHTVPQNIFLPKRQKGQTMSKLFSCAVGTFGRGIQTRSTQILEDEEVLARKFGTQDLDEFMDALVDCGLADALQRALAEARQRASDEPERAEFLSAFEKADEEFHQRALVAEAVGCPAYLATYSQVGE